MFENVTLRNSHIVASIGDNRWNPHYKLDNNCIEKVHSLFLDIAMVEMWINIKKKRNVPNVSVGGQPYHLSMVDKMPGKTVNIMRGVRTVADI